MLSHDLHLAIDLLIGMALWDLGKWLWRKRRNRYQPKHRQVGHEWGGGKAEAEFRRRGGYLAPVEPLHPLPLAPGGPADGAVPPPLDDSWLVMEDPARPARHA